MKIAIVSQYYKPEEAKIPNALAQALVERGHNVRVVTGYPNLPEGRLFPGFRQKLVHHEKDGNIEVRRVPLVISHTQNPIGRFANYASFALSSLSAGRFVRDADVIYVYATQMTAAFAPQMWSRAKSIPFVLHIQDLWPESVTQSSIVRGGFIRGAVDAILKPWLSAVYRRSAAVIAIAPTMQRMLIERGVSEQKVHTILNWADEAHISQLERPHDSRSGLTVVYAGNIGHLQDLENVVNAARLVSDLNGFRVLIFGSGLAEEHLKLVAQGLTNLEFCGRVPTDQMDEVYAKSDFQLVTLRDIPIFRGTIPSKLQGSLAAGIPVITTVVGDVSSLVASADVGLVAKPENSESLAEVFRRAYGMTHAERRQMGDRAKAYYQATMSLSAGVERIEQILQGVARVPRVKNPDVENRD